MSNSQGLILPDFSHHLNGQRFGRLRVIGKVATVDRRTVVLCRCDCGEYHLTRTQDLMAGNVASCGCLHKERNIVRHRTHGGEGSRLYRVWSAMRDRCNNPNCRAYKNYGGRGITICPEWGDFAIFRNWALQVGYDDNLTIERIDNNGPYSPANCRWATRKEQAQNRRGNILVTCNGEKVTLAEASRVTGIAYNLLQYRYYSAGERDLFKPVRKYKKNLSPAPRAEIDSTPTHPAGRT